MRDICGGQKNLRMQVYDDDDDDGLLYTNIYI